MLRDQVERERDRLEHTIEKLQKSEADKIDEIKIQ